MKIWYQLISSETGMSSFLSTVRRLCTDIAAPGTIVEVHGTPHGALGDHYRTIWHYDVREFVEIGLKLKREGGYDVFVIANSLDTALVELREILNIPVISFMEVCCFTACSMGERFSALVQHPKMASRYREIVYGYGLASRLASVESIGFAPGSHAMFTDDTIARSYISAIEDAARRAADRGAEVLFLTGSTGALMASRGVFEIEGLPLLHTYGLLVKAAEAAAGMHRATGISISRKNYYQAPPKELLNRVAELRDVDLLRVPE
jgi:allantoin racemase